MFFCLFLVFHSASERGRKELGTVRLLRSKGGGGGVQKSVVYQNFTQTVTPSRTLHAKGEMCTLQTGKLCYNAININYVQTCKRAQTLVCHGPS